MDMAPNEASMPSDLNGASFTSNGPLAWCVVTEVSLVVGALELCASFSSAACAGQRVHATASTARMTERIAAGLSFMALRLVRVISGLIEDSRTAFAAANRERREVKVGTHSDPQLVPGFTKVLHRSD